MKKVLFIASFPPPYHGVNMDNSALLNHWKSSNYKLIPFDISYKNKDPGTIGQFNLRNTVVAIKNIFGLTSHLRFNNDYEIVLINIAQNSLGFLRDCSLIFVTIISSNARIICRFPGGDFLSFFRKTISIRPLVRFVLKKIDMIITEGEIVNEQFTTIDKSIKVRSAHIGISPNNSSDKISDKPNFRVLYMIGVHRKEKGFWDVLKSIPYVLLKNQKVKFDFVGEISELWISSKDIKKFLLQHNVGTSIVFHGVKYGDQKEELFRRSSVMILPSYSEGFPTSILEAMSFSLPIIASRVGVIPEVIRDGKNGYLTKPGDWQRLGDLIVQLSENEQLAREIGETNRKKFLTNYTVNHFCRRIENSLVNLEN